jgi:hypothetical protein
VCAGGGGGGLTCVVLHSHDRSASILPETPCICSLTFLQELSHTMQHAPEAFTRLRHALRATPGYRIFADASGDGSSEELVLAPTVTRMLGESSGLRWPLPVVAIALLRLGGRVVLSPQQASLEGLTDYSRVVISKKKFDEAITAFRLNGLSARAAPVPAWKASKATQSRTLLDSGIRLFKAALASATQVWSSSQIVRYER